MKNQSLTTKSSVRLKTIIALAVATSLTTSLAHAQTSAANESNQISANTAQDTVVNQSTKSSFEDAWSFADLYDNEQGDYLKLSGRLQLDSTWVDSEQGDYNDTLWRRFRFGFKGKYGEFNVALEADINLNDSLGDSYNRLTDIHRLYFRR